MDKVLKEHFDRFMEKDSLPPEIKEVCPGYGLFKDKSLLDLWRNNRKGLEFLDPTSRILLHGAVDNLLVKDGKLVVLDYKTRGFPLKEDTSEHYQSQMDLYNFLLEKNGYKTLNYTYLLFYYPKEIKKTGEVVFESELKKIKTNAKNGEKIFKKAINIIKREEPRPSADCGFCNCIANS